MCDSIALSIPTAVAEIVPTVQFWLRTALLPGTKTGEVRPVCRTVLLDGTETEEVHPV
ncbi:hypothetical protein JCM19037_4702 [Geomicrobium sp. JCM 19037]|uniref:hypothetical protein n=1 Tax=Geomicrobium sp. JCM 19037 TaxID=1460634 RepID=UPI00045F2A55|nr:hypothetical protein [Geomicrobium sp. JCM 19037]GAK06127.1 hypothetical protein JCM19037_4702 [Geomicrobium sp. JCM 19037]